MTLHQRFTYPSGHTTSIESTTDVLEMHMTLYQRFMYVSLNTLYVLENWTSNFITFFCYKILNSEQKYAVFWKALKIISSPFKSLWTFPYNLSPSKLRASLQYSLCFINYGFIFYIFFIFTLTYVYYFI